MGLPASASRKTRQANSRLLCSLLFIATVAITIYEPALVKAGASSPPSKLFFYVHAAFTDPLSTATSALGYNGTLTGFGAIRVVEWVLREGAAADSPVLGKAAGLTAVLRDGAVYLDFAYVLKTPSYAGTITVQSFQPAFEDGDTAGNEAVITGGTGDFRGARGYVEVRLVNDQNLQDGILSATVYIQYDDCK